MLVNLMEKRKELAEKITEARGLNKVEITEDEKAKYDSLLADVENIRSFIEREEKSQALEMTNPVIEDPQNDPNVPEVRGFKSLGEQLMAVARASKPGARPDTRLVEFRATGLNEGIPSEGGFLVQPEFSTELLKNAYETGILASRVRRIPISATSNSLTINGVDETSRANSCRWGGVVTYWLNEAGTKLPSKPKFKQIELKLKKLIGLCYSTDELMQDATALESIISQAFAEEFGFVIDDAIFEGSGAGMPLGIMNSGSLISVTRTTALKTDYVDICAMYSRMMPRSRAKAVWLINQDVEPALFTMLNGTIPAYMPAGGISGQPYGTLFGIPTIPIEQAAGLGTTGDICFFDLSQYLMIDKGGIQTASSIHVAFLTDEQVFRFVYRVDGMPAMDKAITQFKGTTKSPFIVLTTKLS